MLNHAKHFISDWAATHIQDEACIRGVGPDPRPAALAARCKADAEALGINEEDLYKAAKYIFGSTSLTICMALEIDVCARKLQAEVDRLHAWSTRHRALGKVSSSETATQTVQESS
ncbi:MAG: hypothetical protein ACRYHQ_09570 [Janthinobacterium lividum]